MKTLDIVIGTIENCEIKKQNCFTCPYRNEGSNCYALDALYYLKKLRYILDNMVWVKPEENGHWEIK